MDGGKEGGGRSVGGKEEEEVGRNEGVREGEGKESTVKTKNEMYNVDQ